MKYLHLSTYHLWWPRDALLICRPIPDTGEAMPRRQSPSLDLELAPWWLTMLGSFAPRRHDTNPGTGLVCHSCHLPASHPVRESEGQMGGGGDAQRMGRRVHHAPYSQGQERETTIKFICIAQCQYVIVSEGDVVDISGWCQLTVSCSDFRLWLHQTCTHTREKITFMK